VCEQALSRDASALVCPSGHAFDIAREGYVNLLTSRHSTRGIEGDTLAMLAARRRFLEGGWYDPLLGAVTREVAAALADQSEPVVTSDARRCVAEVGCGEGHYLGGIARALGDPPVAFVGADVSKGAARLASRRHPEATFIVADTNRRLYLRDGSVDVLLDIFAPRNPAEFSRVLAPGGVALVVIPSPSHLASLRRELGLLGVEEEKETRVVERFGGFFDLADRTELEFGLDLTADATRDLVEMGPNHWHASRKPDPCAGGATEASFVLLRFRHARSGPR